MPLETAWEMPGHLTCPQCTRHLKWASGVQNSSRPDPGDNTICSDCGTILTFTDTLTIGVRRATGDEIESALEPEVCRRAYESLLEVLAVRSEQLERPLCQPLKG